MTIAQIRDWRKEAETYSIRSQIAINKILDNCESMSNEITVRNSMLQVSDSISAGNRKTIDVLSTRLVTFKKLIGDGLDSNKSLNQLKGEFKDAIAADNSLGNG